nr:unnamed protein product [Naegleria fowleri]
MKKTSTYLVLLFVLIAILIFGKVRGEASVDQYSSSGNLLVSDDEILNARSDGAVNLYAHLDNAILGEGVATASDELLVYDENEEERAIGAALAVQKSTNVVRPQKPVTTTTTRPSKKSFSSKKIQKKTSKHGSRKKKTSPTSSSTKKSTKKSISSKKITTRKSKSKPSSLKKIKVTRSKTSLHPKIAHAIKLTSRRWNRLKNIFSISAVGGPAFHPFKNEMVFVSSSSGVFQIYKIKIDRKKGKTIGKPVRLVHTKFRCSAPRYLHDGSILYYHDRGGNENFQIGIITPQSKHFWLTKDMKAKHLINHVTKNHLYYQSNARNKKFFDLYRRPFPLIGKDGKPSPAERIYTPENGIPRATLMSSDETQIVLVQRYSNVHNELILKDLVDGTLTPLTKPLCGGAKLRWYPLRFLDRGHTKMLVNTDYQSDFLRLAILDFQGDMKSNTPKFVTIPEMEKYKHDVVGVLGNARTRWTYIELNEGGYSKLYKTRIGPSGFKTPLIPVPLPLENGVIVHGDARSFGHSSAITHDGNLMAVTMTDSTHPVNIYMLDLDPYNIRYKKKQKAIRKLARQQAKKKENGSTATTLVPKQTFRHVAVYWPLLSDDRLPKVVRAVQGKFVKEKLVSVSSFDGLMIPFFMYLPSGDAPEDGFPAIIKLHGGPESQSRPVFSPLIQFLVLSGYAVIVPNVRGSKGYGRKYMDADNVERRMHAVKDVAAIATFLQKFKGIDGNRLVLGGGSYGGYLTNLCMTQIPQYFKAGVSIVGMTNLITFYKNTAEFRRRQRYEEYGNYHTQQDFLKSISPVTYIDNVIAPMFIIQGKNDERVPAEEAENWYKKLIQESTKPGKTQLKYSKLELFANEGHGISSRENRLKAYHDLVNWLNKVLYEKATIPKPTSATTLSASTTAKTTTAK